MIKTSSDFNALVAYFKLLIKNMDVLHFKYLFFSKCSRLQKAKKLVELVKFHSKSIK